MLMNKPLIELKGVSKSFGNNKVLDHVNLSIYRGEALAIIAIRELVSLLFYE